MNDTLIRIYSYADIGGFFMPIMYQLPRIDKCPTCGSVEELEYNQENPAGKKDIIVETYDCHECGYFSQSEKQLLVE